MKGYFYSINKRSASFNFINDTDESHEWRDRNEWSHYPIMHKLLNFMKSRGFEIGRDQRIQKHYKCLNKDHWYGKKGDLEFEAERYPRGFRFEFYQNINFENPNGGRSDFDKFKKMPYLIKLLWINETKKMGNFLDKLGIKNNTDTEYRFAEDKIKKDFVDCDHHPQKDMDFSLKDLDGTTCEANYNNTDRDGRTIYNGEIKYFRDWNGRLVRGKVYHNINNMWWVIINSTEIRNIADFELFDATAKDFAIRRLAKDIKPKEYMEKVESIQKLSNKDLIKELKKRGLEVSQVGF